MGALVPLVVNEPGTTGLEWFWLLLFSSLAFNLLTVVIGMTAFCCLYSDVVCHPCMKRRRHAMQEMYFITKYGDKIHASEKCPALAGSFDIKTFRPCSKCFKVVEGGIVKKTE